MQLPVFCLVLTGYTSRFTVIWHARRERELAGRHEWFEADLREGRTLTSSSTSGSLHHERTASMNIGELVDDSSDDWWE